MSGDSKFFLGVVIGVVIVVAGIVWIGLRKTASSQVQNIDTTAGYKFGPDSAKVKIVEFGDFQCPACQAASVPFRQAQAKNATDVQIIFRHFPLTDVHQFAMAGAQAAEAAGKQNKFWEMYDWLYQNQSTWSQSRDPESDFVNAAVNLGLDRGQFQRDYSASATQKTITDDENYGLSLGVDQTPTFYINGLKSPGVKSLADWQQLIDQAKQGK